MPQTELILPASPSLYGPSGLSGELDQAARDAVVSLLRSTAFDKRRREFLTSVAIELDNMFKPHMLCINVLEPGDTHMCSVVCLENGAIAPARRYSLQSTPCDRTLNPPSVCVFPCGVRERFPENSELAEMGACGYAGMPLFNSSTEPIGNIAMITTEPIAETSTVAAALSLFGHRAALELEYLISDRRARFHDDPDAAAWTTGLSLESDLPA